MDNRQPKYHPERGEFRAVSRPNGQWCAQVDYGPQDDPKTNDRWRDLQERNTDYATAIAARDYAAAKQ